MKSMLKEIIPPIIYKKLEKFKSENSHLTFTTYNNALKSCTTDAYEEQELIEVILKKTQRFVEDVKTQTIPIWESTSYSMIAMLNPLIENGLKEINVLDFGGSCGGHYFHLRNIVDKNLKINWVVVETPTMVNFAQKLATNELSFCSNFEDAVKRLGHIDLIHTSGTLQCVDVPEKYLDDILNCNAKWIFFNRLALNKIDRTVISIHSSKLSWNGIGELPVGYTDKWVKYPFTFISEKVFLEKVQLKYTLIAKNFDQSGMFPINGEDIVGYGLLCKRKT